MAFNDNSYFLGQGIVSLQRRSLNGAPLGGFIDVFDADKLDISPKQTFDSIPENRSGLRLTAGRPVTRTELGFTLNAKFWNKANLASALWGTDTGAVAAGTVSGEAQIAYNNAQVNLNNIGVSGLTAVLTGSTGTIASIAVTAAGSGYTASSLLALTIAGSPGTGATGYAITDASGKIVGAYVTAAGSGYVAPTATVTTPGGGSGATFQVNMGAAALTLNTDYTVDTTYGTVTILPGSLLVPAVTNTFQVAPAGTGSVSVSFSYSYGAYTGKVEAFTTGIQYYALRLNGKNIVNGQPTIVNIHQVQLDMAKMLNLIDSKHGSLELAGELLLDSTIAAPLPGSPYSQFFNIQKA